jgi:hypothetical protein
MACVIGRDIKLSRCHVTSGRSEIGLRSGRGHLLRGDVDEEVKKTIECGVSSWKREIEPNDLGTMYLYLRLYIIAFQAFCILIDRPILSLSDTMSGGFQVQQKKST